MVAFILQFEGDSGITEELLSNEQASLGDWSLSCIENIAGIPPLHYFQPVDHRHMLFPFRVMEVISWLLPLQLGQVKQSIWPPRWTVQTRHNNIITVTMFINKLYLQSILQGYNLLNLNKQYSLKRKAKKNSVTLIRKHPGCFHLQLKRFLSLRYVIVFYKFGRMHKLNQKFQFHLTMKYMISLFLSKHSVTQKHQSWHLWKYFLTLIFFLILHLHLIYCL